MAEKSERKYLENAAKYLLYAAHYSQRIGYVRRATYWLTHASRVYCRLGDLERSEHLSKIVQDSAESVHRDYIDEIDSDSKFKSFISATGYLAEGERLLYQGEYEKALPSFLRALKIFVSIYSTDRLTADTLYGLYRASCRAKGKVGEEFVNLSTNGKQSYTGQSIASIFQKITSTLKEIEPGCSWKLAASIFKSLAQEIWHQWAKGNATSDDDESDRHPIEEAIERDRLLANVSPV